MLNRRDFLQRASLALVATGLPPMLLAKADTDARLVVIVLRGAMDGMAMLAPYGDGNYRKLRGELALAKPGGEEGVLKLDGLFGLHPSMENVFKMYSAGHALLLHAVASPYRARSHFDGQDILENGGATVHGQDDGWLNRALAPMGGSLGNERAIALSKMTPLLLRGDQSVSSWSDSRLPHADDDTLQRIQAMYANDEFFSRRLAQAMESQQIADANGGMQGGNRGGAGARFKTQMQAAARFLKAPAGPRVAVLESGGWDTHANQGAAKGILANRFSMLDEGLAALQHELGGEWSNTVVLTVTEFGRTAAVNGTRGTDHGTASAALLTGGAVNGGRVIADWPGLATADLYEGRDLYPTGDIRSLFKGVLVQHLGLDPVFVDRSVFPDSRSVDMLDDLVGGGTRLA
ncbi:MAG: DUF1501 domain-containing protein [Gammaproteobacteria bacterium]|nr:DUF1501 domain-containing protein [Gammaproteobacteria bacterium]